MYVIKIFLILFLFKQATFAQGENKYDTVGLFLDFPIIDFPYQYYATKTTGNFISSYTNPSMQQSLTISSTFYNSIHYGTKKLIKTKNTYLRHLIYGIIVSGFDILTFYTPLGIGWLHEEYHRAVLTKRKINSFNEMNTFPFGKEVIYVKNIKDEDLIRLSNNHIFDFIRLQAAGLEGQYHQIQYFQSKTFFYNQDLQYVPLYWLSTMSNIMYVNQSCDASYFDKIIDEANKKEGTDISKRDFTGPDFTAWVDALFNPNKPYEERGVHPSGVGINRYIKPSDLNSEEIAYLKKQARLQWLNILSPHLLGFTKINIKSSEKGKYYGNFAIRHLLTSFGNDITLDLFYQTSKDKIFICLHNYNNLKSAFFGIEGEIIDKQILKDKLLLNSKCMLWTQPKDQSFTTKKADLGGMINIRITHPIGSWLPYFEIEGKTKGWVMGNVFLEENLSIRCGINIRVK